MNCITLHILFIFYKITISSSIPLFFEIYYFAEIIKNNYFFVKIKCRISVKNNQKSHKNIKKYMENI